MYLIKMYEGIGDTFYQRHLIKRILEIKGEVALASPWQQLFWDMPELKFWWQSSMLRVQEIEYAKWKFAPIHKKAKQDLFIGYDNRHLKIGDTVPASYTRTVNRDGGFTISDYSLDFPLKPEWVERALEIKNNRPICLVRIPTVRNEWPAARRTPMPGAMTKCLDTLPRDMVRIAVGFDHPMQERAAENIMVNERYTNGELPIEIVAALAKIADLVVTPVGFMTVMAAAVGAKTVNIFGGHAGPQHIFDPRMDHIATQKYIAPDPFCNCFDNLHNCVKAIPEDRLVSEFQEHTKCLWLS